MHHDASWLILCHYLSWVLDVLCHPSVFASIKTPEKGSFASGCKCCFSMVLGSKVFASQLFSTPARRRPQQSNSQLGIARLPQEKAFFATQLVFSLRKSEWLLTKNSRWVQRAMVCSKLHCSTVARMQKHFPICPVMNFFKATKVYIKFTQILWSHEADSCAHPSEARIRTCLEKWSKCLWDFAACRASKSDGCAEWPWWWQTWGRIYRNIGAHLMH